MTPQASKKDGAAAAATPQGRGMSIAAQLQACAGNPQPQSTPLNSLARRGVILYLLLHHEADMDAAHLLSMSLKRVAGRDRDALWSGYWSLKKEADEAIEKLRDRGGLLFVGQPAAIKAAQALEGGAA